jgi:hypothetical protein
VTAKNKKALLILGVGGAALLFWYMRQRGGSLGSLLSGGVASQTPILSSTAIGETDISKLRDAVAGPMGRKQCIFPSRWINTTPGPYYGHCVNQATFDRWIKLPSDVQQRATEDTYQQFLAGKLGV